MRPYRQHRPWELSGPSGVPLIRRWGTPYSPINLTVRLPVALAASPDLVEEPSDFGLRGELDDPLDRAVRAMADHLRPGGVLIVEPWITPANWRGDGTITVETVEQSTAKLVRIIASRRTNDETTLAIHYVRAADGEIESEDERHRLGLFTPERYLEAFAAAGLDARWDDEGLRGRGLVTGVATADVGAPRAPSR